MDKRCKNGIQFFARKSIIIYFIVILKMQSITKTVNGDMEHKINFFV